MRFDIEVIDTVWGSAINGDDKTEERNTSSYIFLRYLFFLCLGIILLVALLIGLFMFAFSANIILPANYAETQITLAKTELLQATR